MPSIESDIESEIESDSETEKRRKFRQKLQFVNFSGSLFSVFISVVLVFGWSLSTNCAVI